MPDPHPKPSDAPIPASADAPHPPSCAQAPWQWWRSEMPIVDRWAYLDHAAVGPLTARAGAALRHFADQATSQGDTVWPQWSARLEQLRSGLAELITADREEICLLPNTTTGINLVAEGFPWQPGDSVVLPEGEFPSNLYPWLNQQSKGVDVRIVPRRDGQVLVDDLMSRVDGSTRIISVSWVGYASGYRLNLDELVEKAHRRGVLVFLDAIQGLGIYPLDVSQTPVDFLAADGHKWMLGPEGAGMGMIRREQLERLRCTNVGWNSVENAHLFSGSSFDIRGEAARFEAGSANMVGMSALAASVELFLEIRRQHGNQAIGERVIGLAETLDRMLGEIGVPTRLPADPQCRSGIVTFDVPETDPAAVRKEAMQRGVVVSCRGGGVRASIHAYNNEDDLARLVEAVQASR